MNYASLQPKLSASFKAAIICCMISLFGFLINKLFLNEKSQNFDSRPAQMKVLKFEDQEDGGVTVIDANTNQVIDVVQGEAGFVRGVLRTIARERRIRGISKNEPLYLISFADGRLILQDTKTNTNIDLESFGSNNVQSFRVFLKNNES
jgi:putative photosynthetic complex assembly protein